MGMRPIVVDTSDAKEELSLKMGAEAFIDFRLVQDVAEEIVKLSDGIGAHGVFVTAPQGYKDAISYTGTRVSAKIMCVGMRESFIPQFFFVSQSHTHPPTFLTSQCFYSRLAPKNTTIIGTDPLIFNLRNLCIMGTLTGTMRDTDLALDYARRGLLSDISEVRGLGRLAESVEQLRRGEVPGRIVIDFNME